MWLCRVPTPLYRKGYVCQIFRAKSEQAKQVLTKIEEGKEDEVSTMHLTLAMMDFHGSFSAQAVIWDTLKDRKEEHNLLVYKEILSHLVKRRDMDTIIETLKKANDPSLYNTTIMAYYLRKELTNAKNVWETWTLVRRPLPATYTIMIDVYCKTRERKKAEAVFRKNQAPTKRNFYHMMAMYKTLGDSQSALKIFEEAEERFKDQPAYEKLHRVLLDLYAEWGDATAVREAFHQFIQRGGVPTPQLYAVLIASQARARKTKMAKHYFHELLREVGHPGAVSYNRCSRTLKACGSLREFQGEIDQLVKDLRKMEKKGKNHHIPKQHKE
jgi:pentatricopeptide repeat protein